MDLAPFFIRPSDLVITRKLLGKGGYGEVKLANYTPQGAAVPREVAVKIFLEQDPGLQKECEALIELTSSTNYICKAVGWTVIEDDFGLVMQRYAESLEDRIKRDVLHLKDVLRHAREIACGLAEIHSRRYVLRDVKPKNALLDEQGNLYLTDFGLVRQLSSMDAESTYGAPGTRVYMAPEVWGVLFEGKGQISGAVDIWALGISIIQMMERSFWAPFTARMSPKELIDKMNSGQVVVPNCLQTSEAKGMLTQEPGLAAIINRCLSVRPADRPRAETLVQELLSLELRHGQPQYRDPCLAGPHKDQHLLNEVLEKYNNVIHERDALREANVLLERKAANDKAEQQKESQQKLAAMQLLHADKLKAAHNIMTTLLAQLFNQQTQLNANSPALKELLPNQDIESSIKDWCIRVGHEVPATMMTAMNSCAPPSQQQQAADKSNHAGAKPDVTWPPHSITLDIVQPVFTSLELKWLDKLAGKKEMDFGVSKLCAEDVRAVARVLATNNKLHKMDLYNNNMGAEGAKALAIALTTNTTLLQLYLYGNNIGDEGAKALAIALTTNTTLLQLSVSNNRIGDEGATAFAAAMTTNRTLRQLDLRGNCISDEGAKALAVVQRSLQLDW